MDRPTVHAPAREVATDIGELLCRKGSVVGFGHRDIGCVSSDLRHGNHVDIVVDLSQGPVATRSHEDMGGAIRLSATRPRIADHGHVRFLVRAVPSNRNDATHLMVEVDPVYSLHKVRCLPPARGGDSRRTSASGRQPHDVHLRATELRTI